MCLVVNQKNKQQSVMNAEFLRLVNLFFVNFVRNKCVRIVHKTVNCINRGVVKIESLSPLVNYGFFLLTDKRGQWNIF